MGWIEDYLDATATVDSSLIFKKWGAISAVAMALERKVWIRTTISALYPNLYVILVAPPGIGKTVVSSRIREMLEGIPALHLSGTSLSKASFIDDLHDAACSFQPDPASIPVLYHSLAAISNELGVLLPKYDPEFMNALTDLYDGKTYQERKRTKELNFTIQKPCVNLLAACTPAYFELAMPDGAWDMGFLSRCFLIYNGESTYRDIFDFENDDTIRDAGVKKTLIKLASMSGEFQITDDFKKAYNDWIKAGGPPAPDHPRLINYNSRRRAHILKLAMIRAASELTMEITMAHFETALDDLIEAEFFMPDIFKAMKNTGQSAVYEETWHFVYQTFLRDKKPVSQGRVVNFVKSRVPVHSIMQTIETMERGGSLKKTFVGGTVAYEPGEKE